MTCTDSQQISRHYVGRFAPSPTGPLHMGSLVAAVGSYIDARRHQGQWLVRIEDLDPPREIPGAADDILATLAAHGLYPDAPPLYQSERHEAYQQALDQLIDRGLVYPCSCSRKTLSQQGQQGRFGLRYPGLCRQRPQQPDKPHFAWRMRTHNQPVTFVDQRVGRYSQQLAADIGDFVLKRADGFFAYQLAVVVDDAFQGITDIVRGEDLLDNTPRQIYLQQQLHFPTPIYRHLPVMTNSQGQKLSKQTFAPALDSSQASANLKQALEFLRFQPPDGLRHAPVEAVLEWAVISHPDF